MDLRHIADERPNPEMLWIRLEYEKQLHDALRTLPEEQRQLIEMMFVDELSMASAAHRIGRTRRFAEREVQSALEHLRSRMGGDA